jgi:hypothetical protein
MELAEGRTCRCGAEIPYRRAKSCAACSRASSKKHYQANRETVLRRHHTTKHMLTPAQLQERRDRAYLSNYVKRGKVLRQPCRCGEKKVFPIQPELGRPLVVVWACRACRPRIAAELHGNVISAPPPIRQPRRERAQARARTWAGTYEQVERELQQWPADRAEALRRAAASVNGMRLNAASPMYRMNLVALYKRVVGQSQPGGAGAKPA